MEGVLAPFAGVRARRLAERLIDRFGGLRRTLAVDPGTIDDEDTAEACRIVQSSAQLISTALAESLRSSPVSSEDPQLGEYLKLKIGILPQETIHAIFVDGEANYLRDETVATGGFSEVGVHGRPLFARALALGAYGIIVAHNHPSGECRPSRVDRDTTTRLRAAAQVLGIVLIDHLIVTNGACFSMKSGKFL